LVTELQKNSALDLQKNWYPTTDYYKEIKTKVRTKEGFNNRKTKKTHRHAIRGTSSTSSSSLSTKATMALAKKGQKYSVKDISKQQKDRAY